MAPGCLCAPHRHSQSRQAPPQARRLRLPGVTSCACRTAHLLQDAARKALEDALKGKKDPFAAAEKRAKKYGGGGDGGGGGGGGGGALLLALFWGGGERRG